MRIKSIFFEINWCFLLFVVHQSAFAIGDGAGGCSADRSPFIQSLIAGNVPEIERLFTNYLEDKKKNRGFFTSLNHTILPHAERVWRDTLMHDFLDNGPCGGQAKPLDYAVAYGSIEGTQWLLQHGANPNAWDYRGGKNSKPISSLFTRCDFGRIIYKGDYFDEQVRQRRNIAYGLTIAAGGDAKYNFLNDPLHFCEDEELLRQLVAAGAKPEKHHLERVIRFAVKCLPGDTTQGCFHTIERTAFFANQGLAISRIERSRLEEPLSGLKNEAAGNVANCKRLRKVFGIDEP